MTARTNGSAGVGDLRRMPVRTITIDFEGDYAGFAVMMRSNPPLRTFTEIQANSDFDSLRKIMTTLVLEWNFVDEDGQPIETGEFEAIPVELFAQLVQRYLGAIVEATAVPKA